MAEPEPEVTEEEIRAAFRPAPRTPSPRPDNLVNARMRDHAEWRKRGPEERGLSAKWYMIMTMQLRGLSTREIAQRLNFTEATIGRITHTERYRAVLESRVRELDVELVALKPKAVEALSNALTDLNRDTALRAARTYFEMTGQGTFGKTGGGDVSGVGAVALAKALVAEARAEVHVHIGGAGPTPAQVEGSPAGSIEALPPPEEESQ